MPGIGNIRAKKYGKVGFATDYDARQVQVTTGVPAAVGVTPLGTTSASKTISVGLTDAQQTVIANIVDRAVDLIDQRNALLVEIPGPMGPAGPVGPSGYGEVEIGDYSTDFVHMLYDGLI